VFEFVKLALVPGTVGATTLAAILVVLKQGPEAVRIVMRERSRLRLIRLALEAPDEQIRKRACDLLFLLESAPPEKQKRQPPPDSFSNQTGWAG
jgi:hypothetical protein